MLRKSQESPAVEQLSHIHPSPGVVRGTSVAMIFHTTARRGGTAVLIPANPSLPLNPRPWNHWRCLWMQHTEPSTQAGSQTPSPPQTAAANSCIPAFHLFIPEEGCERSCSLLCCDNLPRTAPGMFQGVAAQPRSVPGILQVGLMP